MNEKIIYESFVLAGNLGLPESRVPSMSQDEGAYNAFGIRCQNQRASESERIIPMQGRSPVHLAHECLRCGTIAEGKFRLCPECGECYEC